MGVIGTNLANYETLYPAAVPSFDLMLHRLSPRLQLLSLVPQLRCLGFLSCTGAAFLAMWGMVIIPGEAHN